MKKLIVALATFMAIGFGLLRADSPKREFRSAWMAGMGIDWPKTQGDKTRQQQELIDYLDKFKEQNFTGVCIHVRPNADAYYKSTLEPWSSDFTGTRGKDPGWDPLAFAVEECHKRGLECYAWLNPFRLTSGSKVYTTPQDKEWIEKGWIMWGIDGSWRMFNPGVKEARRHCLDVFKEIYTNYDIDGMLFDDYFYPSTGMPGARVGSSHLSGKETESSDYQTWKDSGTSLSLYDWRRKNVNTFVQEVFDEIQKERPDLRFGIGPAGVGHFAAEKYGLSKPQISSSDWQYEKIYADCLAWLSDGSIDFISPQIYWSRNHSTAPHGPLCEWWNMAAGHFGRHCYTSIAAYKLEGEFGGNNTTGWQEIAAQVDLSRQYTLSNAAGQIYYNTQSINGPEYAGLGDYLGENNYATRSLVPKVDWKNRVTYPAVSSLTYSDGTLAWDATARQGRAIIRYTVYAVPLSQTYEQVLSANGDGIDAKYLVDVSYSPTYALPTDKKSGYWYAVCVYDGYGFESEPSLANYSTEYSEKVELLSPTGGSAVAWDTNFSWSSVKDATYTLQISSSPQFATVEYEAAGLTQTSLTVSLDCLESATGYWRVMSLQPGKLASYSATESFKIPERHPAPTGSTISPSDNEDVEESDVEFRWAAPTPEWENCGYTLTLEVFKQQSGDYSDATPIYSEEVNHAAGAVSVAASQFGRGDYAWRLRADGKRWTTGYSDVKLFRITRLVIGTWEKGYEVKTDPAEYDAVGTATLESLWFRSAHSPFDNMSFESEGILNRGMVAVGDKVYVSGRDRNHSNAAIFLSEYDGETGEHIRDIELDKEGRVHDYPCNDVIKDSQGNVCITNLTLNTNSSPVVIFRVDLTTGALTRVATLKTSDYNEYGRCDHVAIYGDVTTGMFTVFMPLASSSVVYRWKVQEPYSAYCTIFDLASFYPADAENCGIAPRVFPISNTEYYLDGGSTAMTFYDWKTMKSSFAEAKDQAPASCGDNGGCVFTLGDSQYIAYNYMASEQGSRFALARMAAPNSFSGMSHLWTFPISGLGNVVSSTCSAPVDVVITSPTTANIYTYSPGNGLAAYRLRTDGTNSIDNVAVNEDSGIHVAGRTVYFDGGAAEASVYDISGVRVAYGRDVTSLQLPASGVYIVRTDGRSKLICIR